MAVDYVKAGQLVADLLEGLIFSRDPVHIDCPDISDYFLPAKPAKSP